jgi:chemotaxis protein MotB
MAGNEDRPIIIKKVKKVAGGHHGGAWKVAYADFVTAMMAFFLLLWLVNTTSPEQKRGIADYFAPASISKSTSGSGGLFGGMAPVEKGARGEGDAAPNMPASSQTPKSQVHAEGQTAATKAAGTTAADNSKAGGPTAAENSGGAKSSNIQDDAEDSQAEEARFAQAEESLRQAMQSMPELAELSKNLIMDETPEGLRIQIVDQDGRPMFPPGSTKPYPRTKLLLQAVAKVIKQLPNRLAISGHTDANPYYKADGTTDWELSAGRANSTRRILQMNGISNDRIYSVSGKAASEPLTPEDPYQPANRRISIVLLREAPVMPPGQKP